LRSWIEVASYQPEQHVDEQDYDDSSNSEGLRVLACSFSPNPDTPAFLAMLDGGGQVNDYLRLKYLLNRRNSNRAKEREDKVRNLSGNLHVHVHVHVLALPSSFYLLPYISFLSTGNVLASALRKTWKWNIDQL